VSIARVIVDVPSRDTDRPFDYAIPERLSGWLEIGSRVAVPFGGRTLQGIVVGLSGEAEVETGRLKAVADVLDAVPPLTEELVELGLWMSGRWLCPAAVALQAMLPAALKGKTEKYVTLAEGAEWTDAERAACPELFRLLERPAPPKLTAVLEQCPELAPDIKRWLREGRLTELQRVENRLQVKKVPTVFPASAAQLDEALAAVPARARKQREVLAYLRERPQPVPLQALTEATGASAAVVKALDGRGLDIRMVEADRDPYAGRSFVPSAPLRLTDAQTAALAPIAEAVDREEAGVFLLHGVTGSGKTEIYLQAIERCLARQREAIVLVPEIALTPQMVERFKSRFGARVAVMHSRLSHGERYDEWRKIREGRAQVAVGARSAVFAPFRRLGLIVIDEEHESSYKQEESPKYHARDVAVWRARRHGAAVVLGSATPSLESYAAARRIAGEPGTGPRPRYVPLPERVGARPLPPVEIVDMREELRLGNRAMFSVRLADAIRERLERQEQIVLLLNRRGYATFVMCRSCGYTAVCPHCEISLTYHRGTRNLRCHYCGHAEPEPESCPSCGSPHIRFFGTGTQKVEEALGASFPGIRVIRMDVDTTAEKGAHEKWLALFRERKADVLLGTQMVAKGLDFPRVTLVGVLAADAALKLPDFRSAERTFQLLTQVAGRAGRHDWPGEVIIQTYEPDHDAIVCAQRHDYAGFADKELRHRRTMGYPPFGRLLAVTFAHPEVPLLMKVGEAFAASVRRRAAADGIPAAGAAPGGAAALEVLGPVASPIAKLKDRYRFQCMVKYRGDVDAAGLTAAALRELAETTRKHGLQVSVDVDPQMML